jgi:hypothetical protein
VWRLSASKGQGSAEMSEEKQREIARKDGESSHSGRETTTGEKDTEYRNSSKD